MTDQTQDDPDYYLGQSASEQWRALELRGIKPVLASQAERTAKMIGKTIRIYDNKDKLLFEAKPK